MNLITSVIEEEADNLANRNFSSARKKIRELNLGPIVSDEVLRCLDSRVVSRLPAEKHDAVENAANIYRVFIEEDALSVVPYEEREGVLRQFLREEKPASHRNKRVYDRFRETRGKVVKMIKAQELSNQSIWGLSFAYVMRLDSIFGYDSSES